MLFRSIRIKIFVFDVEWKSDVPGCTERQGRYAVLERQNKFEMLELPPESSTFFCFDGREAQDSAVAVDAELFGAARYECD